MYQYSEMYIACSSNIGKEDAEDEPQNTYLPKGEKTIEKENYKPT